MRYNELLNLLEIDDPSELSFFEHYAELVENENEISQEVLVELIEDCDKDVLLELTEGYFEDVLKYIPDDAIDFFNLLTSIGQTLSAFASSLDYDNNATLYAEELYKFRNWYLFDSEVRCIKKSDGTSIEIPISQALTLYRLENLNEEEYTYDFSETLDYPLEEYIVPLTSLSEEDDDEEKNFNYEEEDI